ncbi:MAG: hypothetical protein U9P82_02100 [Bacteroidota bacterium]|nr:hypothetical protein [Bacteroidota bacterium]
MKKILISLIAILLINTSLFAQSPYVDYALKFSTNDYSGTARFTGMSGAFGALGGDFSAISINPAGIGVYRNSEFAISTGFSNSVNSVDYLMTNNEDNQYNFNFENFSVVGSYNMENSDTRWVNLNFGVGFNRTNNFNDRIQMDGINSSSLMEIFIANANNYSDPEQLDGMYEYLFWDTYVIGYDTTNNVFFNEITDEIYNNPENFEIYQQKIIETEGFISDFNFTFGGNYANKLYLGGAIGIKRLSLTELASHYELETANLPIDYMKGFDFREYSKTTGTGFDVKLGVMVRPVDFLRIGTAVHFPTFYNIQQDFYNEVVGYFDEYEPEKIKSSTIPYEYQLISPFRFVESVSFQIKKVALINIDYEFANFSKIKLDDDEVYIPGNSINDDEKFISDNFSIKQKLRVGAELRLGPLYFRGGGAYSTSPYENKHGNIVSFSGGLGYRENKFFIDLAFVRSMYQYDYYTYDWPYGDQLAQIDNSFNNFILTAGVKF